MSSGQTPRTPRYFPNMKVRGKRRRGLAPWQLIYGAFERLALNGRAAAEQLTALATAGVSEPLVTWREPVLPTERTRYEAITAEALDRLDTSILEVESAEH